MKNADYLMPDTIIMSCSCPGFRSPKTRVLSVFLDIFALFGQIRAVATVGLNLGAGLFDWCNGCFQGNWNFRQSDKSNFPLAPFDKWVKNSSVLPKTYAEITST